MTVTGWAQGMTAMGLRCGMTTKSSAGYEMKESDAAMK
jgi:hypothetical protein